MSKTAQFRDLLAWRLPLEPRSYCAPVVSVPELLVRFAIAPCPAPRMSRKDAFAPSPAVVRYNAYRNRLGEIVLSHLDAKRYCLSDLLAPIGLRFYVAGGESLSLKKRMLLAGAPKLTRPDYDNFAKGFHDALFEDDSRVWDVRVQKRWAGPDGPCVEVWRMPAWV